MSKKPQIVFFSFLASFVCNSINLVESGKAESAKLPIPPIKQRAALLEDLIGKRRFWRERKKERKKEIERKIERGRRHLVR